MSNEVQVLNIIVDPAETTLSHEAPIIVANREGMYSVNL